MSGRSKKFLEVQIAEVGDLTKIIKKIYPVVREGYLIFVKPDSNNEKGGIVLQQMSEDKNIYVDMRLESKYFDPFTCTDKQMRIGIDFKNFFTVLNLIKDNVPVNMYMRHNSTDTLYVRSVEDRPVKIDFILIKIDDQQIPKMSLDGRCRFKINRNEFRSICSELNGISDKVMITATNDTMTFNVTSKEIGVIEKSMDVTYMGKNTVNVDGEFDVSKILSFIDYIKKEKETEIIMDKDFPLVLLFDIPNLGTMKVSFSPIDSN
uniref:Proliferating cell nuclear antigen PCNA N-terminal domain-containing protein n=1 Tax=viral metagenome TaxID=1070528 RepID=A0A6C0C9C6_9ZZZZ